MNESELRELFFQPKIDTSYRVEEKGHDIFPLELTHSAHEIANDNTLIHVCIRNSHSTHVLSIQGLLLQVSSTEKDRSEVFSSLRDEYPVDDISPKSLKATPLAEESFPIQLNVGESYNFAYILSVSLEDGLIGNFRTPLSLFFLDIANDSDVGVRHLSQSLHWSMGVANISSQIASSEETLDVLGGQGLFIIKAQVIGVADVRAPIQIVLKVRNRSSSIIAMECELLAGDDARAATKLRTSPTTTVEIDKLMYLTQSCKVGCIPPQTEVSIELNIWALNPGIYKLNDICVRYQRQHVNDIGPAPSDVITDFIIHPFSLTVPER